MKIDTALDVLIVGGGPAGLSAALVLGRSRRRVVVVDSNEPRSVASRAMHGFLTRDGIHPAEFRQIAREQLGHYPNVTFRDDLVTRIERHSNQFSSTLASGETIVSRMLLLATGVVDEKPKLRRFDEFWGKTVHLCPYCDGWEHQDQPIVIHGRGAEGVEFALEMLGWSSDLVLCTDGPANLAPDDLGRLEKANIRLIETEVATLEGDDGQISGVRFIDNTVTPCHALFFTAPQKQRSDLAHTLGCQLSEDGVTFDCKEGASTNVPGVFLAGNTSRGLQLVIMAAAEGTQAAFTINQALLDADCPA